jgi:hypothetical protein
MKPAGVNLWVWRVVRPEQHRRLSVPACGCACVSNRRLYEPVFFESKPMNAKDLAAQLSGIQYPVRIPKTLTDAAKAAGLVIVYGASDDLMEFEGAIYDEVGCYDGDTAYVDARGLLPERDQIEDDDQLKDYFARQPNAKPIEAVWDGGTGYSWTYKTDIPHETFEVLEDGEPPYCRGIVFSLSNV